MRTYLDDQRGAVALIFALMFSTIVFAAGMALDYSRSRDAVTKMQTALDAAVLAASASAIADDQRQGIFEKIFAENFATTEVQNLDVKFTYTAAGGGKGSAKADVPTTLLRAVGKESMATFVESSAAQADFDIEIVMVLDVSGSMLNGMGSGSRIDILKASAKKLVNIVEGYKMPSQKVSYAIVPFTMNVNIGTANSKYVDGIADPLFTGTAWAGCVIERPDNHANDDVYNAGGPTAGGNWHAYISPPEPDTGNQCLNPSNGTNTGYQSIDLVGAGGVNDPLTRGPNYNCVRHPLLPLTSNAGDVLSKIDSLDSHGNMGTIAAPGIAWGTRLLSPQEPFPEGAPYGNSVRKIMVVITDGEQTTEGPWVNTQCPSGQNSSANYSFDPAKFGLTGSVLTTNGPRDAFSPYGYMLDSGPFNSGGSWTAVDDAMEKLTLDACTKFKANGASSGNVSLFTIAASNGAGPGTRVYDLLRNCASDPDHFFYADSEADMDTAFTSIGKQASELHLTQ